MRGATAKEKGPPRRSRTGPVGGGNRKPTYPCAALRNGIEVTRPRPVFPRKAWRWNSGRSRGVPPSDEAMGALIAASGQAIQQKAPPERGSHLGIRRRPPEAGRSDKLCLRGTWRRTQSILFHALHSVTTESHSCTGNHPSLGYRLKLMACGERPFRVTHSIPTAFTAFHHSSVFPSAPARC